MRGLLTHRRLRAPRNSGEVLVEPPLADLVRVVERNRKRFSSSGIDIRGYALHQLRELGISQLLAAAVRYTNSYRDVDRVDLVPGQAPLVLSGHQPQLFHPGVWFKNFALAAAGRLPAVAVHMVIDNDVCLHPSIRVPCGPIEDPHVETFAYDAPGAESPYEERTIRDAKTFRSFGSRVADAIRPWIAQPLLRELWPMAVSRLAETNNLGLSISQARHQLESQWKLNTLEVPLSWICQTDAFRIFTLHLLRENERLQRDYNQSLADYRQVHRIRSRSHPVPELITAYDAREAPFWVWTGEAPIRRRLFARCVGDDLQLTDGRDLHVVISGALRDGSNCVEQLGQLERERGIKIRPRALTTTMFGRLVLSDVFFHGIGGAKYDQLTDEIVRRFFRSEPPEYVTMTATAQLPLPLPTTTADDVLRAAKKIRDARYHPENLFDGHSATGDIVDLLAAKKFWIAQSPPRGQRSRRHHEIERINTALRNALGNRQTELRDSLERLRGNLRRKALLGSREFSFCLFPRESFEELLLVLS